MLSGKIKTTFYFVMGERVAGSNIALTFRYQSLQFIIVKCLEVIFDLSVPRRG